MRRLIAAGLTIWAGSGSAAWAHDFWLQPQAFQFAAPVPVPMTVEVGHGKDRERWSVDPSRVIMLRSIGPDGTVVDRRSDVRGGPLLGVMRLAGPGSHIVAMQTNHAKSDLPAQRFNDYVVEEGIAPIARIRAAAGTTNRPGREIYSRRSKTLIRFGSGAKAAAVFTRPVGLSLEIVPERDPYALPANVPLPVRVLWQGRALVGAMVKLTNLEADAMPVAKQRTDKAGRTAFRIPRQGSWLLNVVWSQPIAGNPEADFDTTFSSLSFGYPRTAPAR